MLEKIVLEYVLPILAPIVTVLLMYLVKLLIEKINSGIKDEKLRQAMYIIEDTTEKVVQEMIQTKVDALKNKSKNGTLTEVAAAEVKQLAADKIKEQTGKAILDVGNVLKLNADQVSNLIGTKIEAAVYRNKIRTS